MSNVLIGIIGVILFISLALAGALILGDDFRTSKHTTRAAAVAQHLQQLQAAMNMYQLKTGRTLLANEYNAAPGVLIPRFLKNSPTNPVNGTPYYGTDIAGSGTPNPIKVIYTNLGTDEQAKQVCRAIEEGAGSPNPDTSMVGGWSPSAPPNGRVSCVHWGGSEYDAYIPL